MLLFVSIAISVACEELNEIPSALQVAWISPVRKQVGVRQDIEVVRLHDLQLWINEQQPTAKEVLHQMGMLSKLSVRDIDSTEYKITIFDVEQEWLCRPIREQPEGLAVQGVSVCEAKKAKPASAYARYGFTGCGYTYNTQREQRGFDVYRIDWSEASTWGFCVLPLNRFLAGRPK